MKASKDFRINAVFKIYIKKDVQKKCPTVTANSDVQQLRSKVPSKSDAKQLRGLTLKVFQKLCYRCFGVGDIYLKKQIKIYKIRMGGGRGSVCRLSLATPSLLKNQSINTLA